MPCHLLHRSLKGLWRLVTAEFAGGFSSARVDRSAPFEAKIAQCQAADQDTACLGRA